MKSRYFPAVAVLALVLAGCAVPRSQDVPLNVAMLPHDCRNRQIMLEWLDSQARQSRRTGENEREFARSRNEIRKKMWDIRYHCQSV